jgi:hypothetical protein
MHDCLCDGAIDVTTSLPAGDLHDRPRSVWRTELTKGHKIPKNNLSDDGIKAEQQINDDGRSLPHRGSEGPLRFRPARWMARRCAPYNETGAAWCQPSLLRCIKCLRCKGFLHGPSWLFALFHRIRPQARPPQGQNAAAVEFDYRRPSHRARQQRERLSSTV